MDKIVEDDELGRLIVRVNSRARSLVFRTKSDAVYVSVPLGTTLKEVKQAIENLRGKLLASRQKLARPLIDLDYKIDAEHFKLSLVSGEKDQFLANSRLGVMEIVCPPHADFTDEKLQSWLHKVIEGIVEAECEKYPSFTFGFLVQAMRTSLFECENKLQSGQMGQLLGSKGY